MLNNSPYIVNNVNKTTVPITTYMYENVSAIYQIISVKDIRLVHHRHMPKKPQQPLLKDFAVY